MTLKAILKVSAAGVLGVALYAGAVGAQPTAVPRASQSAAGSPSLDKNRSADGVLPSGFPYSIKIPTNWNGVVVSDLDAAGGRNELGDFLVANGFAYVGTGRHPERMLKHDPLTELEAQAAVLRMVRSSGLAPRHTVQLGCSGGRLRRIGHGRKVSRRHRWCGGV